MTKTARIYGTSLYDLAVEEGLEEQLLEEIQALRVLFWENPDYLKLLQEPSIAKEERLGLIDQSLGGQVQHYLVNFVKLLCERGILREFAGCCEEYTRRYDVSHDIVSAMVTSAVELSEQQKNALHDKLEQISHKTVRMQTRVDAGVIGGLRVELDGKLLDGTVSSRLNGISRKLNDINV